jgi:hypothetical protein
MTQGVPKKVIEMLAQVPLFSACSKTELPTIVGLGSHLNIRAGATLIKQGAVGRQFFLVTSGQPSA